MASTTHTATNIQNTKVADKPQEDKSFMDKVAEKSQTKLEEWRDAIKPGVDKTVEDLKEVGAKSGKNVDSSVDAYKQSIHRMAEGEHKEQRAERETGPNSREKWQDRWDNTKQSTAAAIDKRQFNGPSSETTTRSTNQL
ncbi:uncharacterized protein MONBRDRAFT_23407 [Monosiga brevicollis MX1]|uniref:Uncharacterized protein n=1 Tax=Monosiga brevicollis TaxID=81824 RepID=A9UTB1_MONBE|nr:uncharacterized protein MONBRDRAFT_23407 [Monosiga brevicollis MX1]EDQ91215.1 predicted protein [Monosiga brevicollis MX1]|eukprot:XP_001743637.1 hypothetical protein [Monosiga brevicollis MX1]